MKKLFLAFIIYHSAFLIAQERQVNISSHLKIWQDQRQPDSIRVSAYSKLIQSGFLHDHPDTAEILAEALHDFAKAQQYPWASAIGYLLQGKANSVQYNFPRALEFHQKSLAISEELGNKKDIASNLYSIGIIHLKQGNRLLALEYLQRSLPISMELGNKKDIASNLYSIGIIHLKQGNRLLALEYLQRSLEIYQEIEDKINIGINLGNIGIVHEYQGNYHLALEFYQRSLAISEEIEDKLGVAYNLNNIGIIYENQGNYPRALEYYKRVWFLWKKSGIKQGSQTT